MPSDLRPGQSCHGFRLLRREAVAEIPADALIFHHQVTGAELLVLLTDDDNKVFTAAFLTPPSDDTGVPHILEHSVLAGSQKYPLKEPFAELLKGSLQTFLNAFTYPDRTLYPVASRNAQDFHNLVDVYLDAVFHPRLDRLTFLQEGWRLEMPDAATAPAYSGVVYNEMLGATSDPETLLFERLQAALLPGTVYRHNSGGDPAAIPGLSYEQFVAFHQRYYHPANCRLALYGDLDVEAQLAHLQEYLGTFAPLQVAVRLPAQRRFTKPRRARGTYPISPDEDPAGQTYALRAWLLAPRRDPDELLAAHVLARVLSGSPASPLRKALIDAHLGQDTLAYGLESDLKETYYTIGLRGTDAKQVAPMEQLIDTTLARLADGGLDPRDVWASFNSTEFQLREANFSGYPAGLVHSLNALTAWGYGHDPLPWLRYEAPLARLREKLTAGGYFEGFIRQHLLDNPHRVTVVLRPDGQYEARRLARLAQALQARRAAMDAAAVAATIADGEALRAMQAAPDAPAALATIPKLPLSCVSRQAERYPFTLLHAGGSGTPAQSYSELDTRGIAYLKLAFDAQGLPGDLLPYVALLGRYTLQTGTARRDFVALQQEIDLHTGGIGGGFVCSTPYGAPQEVCLQYGYNAKALTGKVGTLCDLLAEVLAEASLASLPRLLDITRSSRAALKSRFAAAGYSYANTRLAANLSRVGQYEEATGGLSQFEFQTQLLQRLATQPEQVVADLERLRTLLFTRERLHLHLTGGPAEQAALAAALPRLLAALPSRPRLPGPETFPVITRNEALIIPSKVQYVAKGANLFAWGYTYTAAAKVLCKWLSRAHLWNEVRVKGGAYGCFVELDAFNGEFTCCSYRDPHLESTLGIFDGLADTISSLDLSADEFEKLQIATMGESEAPRTAEQKGAIALNRYVARVSQETVQAFREQVLDCTVADLRAHGAVLQRFAREGLMCVVGGEAAIRPVAARFGAVRTIFGEAEATADEEEED